MISPAADQRAHHHVPLGTIRKPRALLDAAGRGGFRTDGANNMALCPKDSAAQASAKAKGVDRPVHDSGHPDHNDASNAEAKKIEDELAREGFKPGTSAYDKRAAELVRDMMDRLRQALPKSDRVTENTPSPNSEAA